VRFSDGGPLSPGTVIWATGFELDHSFVHLPVFDADGRLVHRRGVTTSPGLYFLGMPWQHTRGSALLGWVKDDAHYIADQIATLASRPIEVQLSCSASPTMKPSGPRMKQSR
jgi:putative flavoprotein involved in K+ transport